VVEDGRIVESGTPGDLRARGGRFAELFARWMAGAA
jgi:ABC-type multidrug transport system fused ATPase/permease subunit